MKNILLDIQAINDLKWWITQEHRLIYEVTEQYIRVISCRYHYRK